MSDTGKKRIAAIADLHVHKWDQGKWASQFKAASEQADILLLCGDLTDTGIPEEADVLAGELRSCRIPVVGVLGNHDYESEQHEAVKDILNGDQVYILDGDSVVVDGMGFAGVKGFGGGFGRFMLPVWGEQMNKQFVQASIDEALRLDKALVRLENEGSRMKKIVLTHYAPIPETLEGEPEQIFPFLGSSHLAGPLENRQVTAAFHGHAHSGALEGSTPGGLKVFNVSYTLLQKKDLSFYLTEL